jgi:hypothetical protein
MIVGKCPYCKDGTITMVKKPIRGKNTKYYSCTNAKYYSEDGELFELTSDSTCNYRLFGNALLRYGKRGISQRELRRLLNGDDVAVKLYSMRAKKEYYKYIELNQEYGVSVIWDVDVDEETIEEIS